VVLKLLSLRAVSLRLFAVMVAPESIRAFDWTSAVL